MKNKIPSIEECIAYMATCNYRCANRSRGSYLFIDNTNTRPLHIREMFWTLNELRHALKYGW